MIIPDGVITHLSSISIMGNSDWSSAWKVVMAWVFISQMAPPIRSFPFLLY